MNSFDIEAKVRWGDTDAYKEHSKKTADYSADKWQEINAGLMDVFYKFAECKQNGCSYDSNKAQALVKELQCYITENYYTCTNQILAGLGQMYIADQRFTTNIDKCSVGTAAFVSDAIKFYCKG